MKVALRGFVLVLAGAAGITLGIAIRAGIARHRANEAALAAVSADAANSDRLAGKLRHKPSVPDDSPLATRLERDLAAATGAERWFYWLDALEKAGPADFPRLFQLAQGKPAAMRFVASRWAEVAPRHLFDFLVAAAKEGRSVSVRELANTLFTQWPKKDPEAAIAALNEPESVNMRESWRHLVADGVLATDVERGLRLMSEWHIENYGPRMNTVAKWAAADPQHAAEFTLQNPAGYVSQLSMETIGKEWAKTAPAIALDYAAAHPGTLGSALGRAALQQWAGKSVDEAADWLATADARTRSQLSPAFVEAWAQKDASAALAWSQENLNGSSLAQAVGGVVKGVAEKDVAAAAALVDEMPSSPARSAAAAEVARKWFPEGLAVNQTVKPEAIAWMTGLDDDARRQALDAVVWAWAGADPFGMARFLASLGPEQVPSYADSVLVRQMVRKDASKAIDWASQLPGERGLNAGAEAFADWRDSQPEAAMKWFNELASDDPRREPFFQNAIRDLAYHPQAAEELAAMSEPERAAARNVLEKMSSLPAERRTELLQAVASH
jgi:hypothetical protein